MNAAHGLLRARQRDRAVEDVLDAPLACGVDRGPWWRWRPEGADGEGGPVAGFGAVENGVERRRAAGSEGGRASRAGLDRLRGPDKTGDVSVSPVFRLHRARRALGGSTAGRRPTVRLGLGLIGLLGATACTEEPAFRVRWHVEGMSLVMGTAADCSRVGISAVEISTFNALGTLVDQRVRACFPPGFEDPDATVAGPALPPGRYAVVVRGVRRDRVGWYDIDLLDVPVAEDQPDDPTLDPTEGGDDGDGASLPSEEALPGLLGAPNCTRDGDAEVCPPGYLVCDCRFIEVVEGKTLPLRDFELPPPPECENGIDDDLDGQVDIFDAGCRGSDREDADVNSAQFRLLATLLDRNPNAFCVGVGIARFDIRIDGEPVLDPICRIDPIFFSADLVSGEHVLEVAARNAAGELVTEPESFTFEVPKGGGGFFPFEVDFSADDFIEPLVERAPLSLQYIPYPGAPQGRGCDTNLFGQLDLAQVRIRLLDSRGEPLPEKVHTEPAGLPLDGTPIACPSAVLLTEPLTWGAYHVEVEALSSEGEVCFSNVGNPERAAPRESRVLNIPRVLVDGPNGPTPPPSCEDCSSDADCQAGTCQHGICVH